MPFRWLRKKVGRRLRVVTRRRRRRVTTDKNYEVHKERARILVHERLNHWNQLYGFTYNRVAIRNQCSRWGSCSTKQNLNFNYRLIFLPIELVDYVIVHELCHLKHFNHGKEFWATVAETIADYESRKEKLRDISKTLHTMQSLVPLTETLPRS